MDRFSPALFLLLESARYAQDSSQAIWDFAVEIDELIGIGLSRSDLRWLVCQQLIKHQREITAEGDNERSFHPTGKLTFSERTCFILTESGFSVVRSFLELNGAEATQPFQDAVHGGRNGQCEFGVRSVPSPATEPNVVAVPKWEPNRRELRLNGQIIKRFKWPALNQEAILSAFEEEGWPSRIDDPLPPRPEQDSKRRLSDTIKCLNRTQSRPLLHFRGDGTGEGVVWEIVEVRGEPTEED